MTRAGARWGCFLPDLTRLASGSSTTNLPSPISAIFRPNASRAYKKLLEGNRARGMNLIQGRNSAAHFYWNCS
jgi:hypothetical protein